MDLATAAGALYVVATPLGNLEDLSPRAASSLREAGHIFAEDTRRTRVLLQHIGHRQPRIASLHAHNEKARVARVLELLAQGVSVALVSDAGTPAVSDPGAAVAAAAHAAGHRVVPIPGPCAWAAAVSAAGFELGDAGALFLGFLPVKGEGRVSALARINEHAGVVVLFEAPHRIAKTLADLETQDGDRLACVCRELTKVHEELRRASVRELAAWARAAVRGEVTLVLGPRARAEVAPAHSELDAAVARCLAAGLTARDVAAAVAAVLQVPRRTVYARVQALR